MCCFSFWFFFAHIFCILNSLNKFIINNWIMLWQNLYVEILKLILTIINILSLLSPDVLCFMDDDGCENVNIFYYLLAVIILECEEIGERKLLWHSSSSSWLAGWMKLSLNVKFLVCINCWMLIRWVEWLNIVWCHPSMLCNQFTPFALQWLAQMSPENDLMR